MSEVEQHLAGKAALAAALDPVAQALVGVDLTDPQAARAIVCERLPLGSEPLTALRAAAETGAAEGWLLSREAGGIRFGRAAKDLHGFSVDAVLMAGPGPRHRHPKGEIDLCFTQRGEARFDGEPEGWVVYGPDSVHVPTVRDGEMLILYFLPGGAIEFLG
ncbi:MAG: DUF4863 family protein [Planctomycetes bacterium]|nr:DUF4863 family protein [Planctomycetota bacterium]